MPENRGRTPELAWERPPETEAEVTLATLSRASYPEGSVGFIHFPESLEGRDRPADYADRPLYYFGKKTLQQLHTLDATTLTDLLHLPMTELTALPGRYQKHIRIALRQNMQHLEKNQLPTPHGRLVGVVLGAVQGPVDPDEEPALAETVQGIMSALIDDRDAFILERRFGLRNWKPARLEEVGEELRLTRERIRQLESRAFAKLRHPQYQEPFQRLQRLSVQTLGYELGYRRPKDIPDLPLDINALDLSPETSQHLQMALWRIRPKLSSWQNFMAAEYEFLPEEMRGEAVAKIQHAQRQYRQHVVFGDILPEVSDTDDAVNAARNTPVADLNFSPVATRWLSNRGLETLGALVDVAQAEGEAPEQLAPTVTREVGAKALKLVAYLDDIAAALPLPDQP